MRPILTITLVVLSLTPVVDVRKGQASTQVPCQLSGDKAPAIRGLRLGMTAEELSTFFPDLSPRNLVSSAQREPNYGVARLFYQVDSPSPPPKERFTGIDSISIILFDGQVTEITVRYAGAGSYPVKGPSWRNVDDFIAKLSEAFGLPQARDWLDRSTWAKTLKCAGFTLDASADNGTGEITLRGTTAYQETVRQRALANQERRRREFKP